jgi:hypothetical protein
VTAARQTDRQTDRQANREADRETATQTIRQRGGQKQCRLITEEERKMKRNMKRRGVERV